MVRGRVNFRIGLLLLCVCTGAEAMCLPVGDASCLPRHPLAEPFFRAVRDSYACLDTFRVEADGTTRPTQEAPPDLVGPFVRAHGDGAIGLYETAANQCSFTSLTTQAIRALALLRSPRARKALERLRTGASTWVRREDVVLYMATDPEFRAGAHLEGLWKDEGEVRIRRALASLLARIRDPATIDAIRKWSAAESDPEVLERLRIARVFIENPGRCALVESSWAATRGARCLYTCPGDSAFDRWEGWSFFSCPEARPREALLRAKSVAALRRDLFRPWIWCGVPSLSALLLTAAVVAMRQRKNRVDA